MVDKIFSVIEKEKIRQQNTIELIASENFVSENVLKAQGSILTNKYAEGYPGKRYYGGCKFVDEIENMAIDAAKELFGVRFANVQPHSGSSANMAVYRSLLKKKDKIIYTNLEKYYPGGLGEKFVNSLTDKLLSKSWINYSGPIKLPENIVNDLASLMINLEENFN